MSSYQEGVEQFAQVVDEARGRRSIQSLAQAIGLNSQQALSNKLNGKSRFTPDEVARLSEELRLDVLEMLGLLWPDVGRVIQQGTTGDLRSDRPQPRVEGEPEV